ncbi:MAG: gliding motility-associated C-terminal domain-containing protein [Bacteroidales bacterium]|nr:gliding motility-associated C-terminal domain-containing protein [Bacteroidales bacterium]
MKRLFLFFLLCVCGDFLFAQMECNVKIIPSDTVFYTNSDTTIVFSLSNEPNFSVTWSGDNLNVSDSLHPTTILLPNVSQQYSVRAVYENSLNLVTNGDFESGNTGFYSQLNYVSYTGTQALWNEGTYSVGTNPHNYHQNWISATHQGNMLIANGATNPGVIVYQTTINVQPYTDYVVKFEAANIDASANNNNIARFQFSIDGQMVGSIFPISQNVFQWDNYYQIWNSGNSSQSTITIVNQNTQGGGNDFAIDNIEVHELCVATDTITLQSVAYYYDTVDYAICDKDSFVFIDDTIIYNQGQYTDTIFTSGRDTIRTLNLTVYPLYSDTIEVSICANESYDFFGNILNSSGKYIDTLQSTNGCDSVITLFLDVNPVYDDTIYAEICEGSIYEQNNFSEDYTGVFSQFLVSVDGCDSISTLNLIVREVFQDSIVAQIYKGETYTDYGFSEMGTNAAITEEGEYTYTFQNQYGCDSTYILNLSVIELKFPNVITANGDGINDVFEIYDILRQTIFEETELFIYSRYGKRVYYKKNISKYEDFWDPAATNTSSGTFFYRFLAKSKHRNVEFSGTIEVLK